MLKYLNAIKELLFPNVCFYCEDKIQNGILCKNCREKIEFLYPPVCRFCSKPLEKNKTLICKDCQNKEYPYDRLISVASYKEPLISLLYLFKYKNYYYIGDFLSSIIIEYLLKIGFNLYDYDFIIPVPLHPVRLKEREYNQSFILARFISNYFKMELKDDIIYKIKDTVSQTKLKGSKRIENIKNTFIIKNHNIKNKKVIIIDDVFTTGSTLYECSRVLKENNHFNITLITLCKTL